MTLQDFKAQVAREQYCDNWKVFQMNCIIQGEFQRMDDSNDRAATLFAEHERKEASPKWISMEDKTPPFGTLFIVHGDGETDLAYYTQKGWRQGRNVNLLGITHWMPLPNKPE